jgi:hypothetical protein
MARKTIPTPEGLQVLLNTRNLALRRFLERLLDQHAANDAEGRRRIEEVLDVEAAIRASKRANGNGTPVRKSKFGR